MNEAAYFSDPKINDIMDDDNIFLPAQRVQPVVIEEVKEADDVGPFGYGEEDFIDYEQENDIDLDDQNEIGSGHLKEFLHDRVEPATSTK